MYFRLQIVSLLVLNSCLLFSQLHVKNFYSFTGKKDVEVNVISQDHDGFLLVGSKEGIYKFDGVTSIDMSKDYPFLKKEITALHTDNNGVLWIGTKKGKVYYLSSYKADSINFSSDPNSEKITSFASPRGGICIGTYGNGIFTWNGKDLKHLSSGKGLGDDFIYTLYGDPAGTIWCGTDGGITKITDVFGKPVYKVISDKNGLPDNIVRDICPGADRLLIAMQDSGICYYNLKKDIIERDAFFSNWGFGAVLNVYYSKRGKLIIATEKNGLLQIVNGRIISGNYDEQLHTNSVNRTFMDREKQIWLASKKGISRIYERRYNFLNVSEWVPDNKILALVADNNNNLFIGTTAGISKIMLTEEGKPMLTRLHENDKYTISCASRAPDGNIWFGTYGNGLIILSPESKHFTVVNSTGKKLTNDNISRIYFAGDDNVYIATLGGGLIEGKVNHDQRSDPFTIIRQHGEQDGLGSNYIYDAITDKAGRLFVATDGGGMQMREHGKFVNLVHRYGFSSTTVFSLCRDRNNSIWGTSSNDGLLRYNGDSLISISQKNGLRDIQPQQIIAVDNTLYTFNSRGIDKVNIDDGTVTYYDIAEGDTEPNLNAVFYDNDKIYCGTGMGVLTFRTGHESADSVKPKVFISKVQVNFGEVAFDSVFEFSHSQNNMVFGFNGIWLRNPDKLVFRYRLHGLEENWNFSDEGKFVNYNNLDPGKYTFMVQAKNEEDVWSDPTGYSFIILTPIWSRWWFWVIVCFAGGFIIYGFVRYRLKALQRENQLLERRVEERTYFIERQAHIIEEKNKKLEQLSLVASKTDNVVLILDEHGNLEYVNESFMRLNRLNPDEATGKYGDSIYNLSNNPGIREIVNDAIENRKSVNYESLNRNAGNGSGIWESSTLTPLFDNNNRLKKIIIIDTDVTERKKQEQIIIQKNKDITDSISYARKIQHAILPDIAFIRTHVPSSFILYLTKDIVSGDFYWFNHFGDFSIIAAVDCTGHGVPGAFMSLIGYNQLNRIVNENRITEPGEILLELNKGVLGVIHKNESESKDGMDIAICRINHREGTLDFAGAMRPLWIINGEDLTEIKADKIPIGTKQKDRQHEIIFKTTRVVKKSGDVFYIFTDGFADQFGGDNDKKYSTGRLKKTLIAGSRMPLPDQEKKLRQEHLGWKGRNEQVDDILMIGFSF